MYFTVICAKSTKRSLTTCKLLLLMKTMYESSEKKADQQKGKDAQMNC